MFRAPRKGWAVRSWDFIPSGAPVCEYIGILNRAEDMENASENNYIFDIDCLQTMRGLGGREVSIGYSAFHVNIPLIKVKCVHVNKLHTFIFTQV